ncbi:MAG: hypothetical protein ACR2PQ_06915 [Myxococcota bacterium]
MRSSIPVALGIAAALLLGCSEALVARSSYRSHESFTDESLARFERAGEAGVLSKAQVLASLGPPSHTIGQPDGEIFVYRREALDRWVIELNPAFVPTGIPTPPIPLYFGSFTRGRDDTLMVFFDRDGHLRGRGVKLTIDAADEEGR